MVWDSSVEVKRLLSGYKAGRVHSKKKELANPKLLYKTSTCAPKKWDNWTLVCDSQKRRKRGKKRNGESSVFTHGSSIGKTNEKKWEKLFNFW